MSVRNDLYREIILDHFKSPRNRGKLPQPALKVEGANPLCGDEVELFLLEKDGALADVRIETHGCSISQAAASMMTEVVKGLGLDAAEKLAGEFKEMMLGNGSQPVPEDFGDLEALEGVKKYPVRIKCALLAWNTLLEGIKALREHKPAEQVIME